MIGQDIIESARSLTLDKVLAGQTWETKDYLQALNDGRSVLYGRYPEAFVTDEGGFSDFSLIEESNLSENLPEDEVYREFLIHFVVSRYYGSNPYDTAGARAAKAHQDSALLALDFKGARRG